MTRPAPSTYEAVTVDGNRLELLPDGSTRLATLLAMIAGARFDCRVLFYIFTDDATAVCVRDALVEAVRRGVVVRVLLDGFGSGSTSPAFFDPLRDVGGDVCVFHPRYGRRYLIRNHQKMAIVDGQCAIIGGANIEESYLVDDGPDRWRDLWVKVDGPAVEPLADYFDAIERWTRNARAGIRQLRRLLTRHSQSRGSLQWKFSGPMARRNPWPMAIVRDILGAERLDIVAAYFAPSWAMLGRIGGVVRRGGSARVVTAAKSDNNATIAAARFTYRKLLRNGVEMFEYAPAKLHTKLFVVDDIVHIGSANFDIRSIYLNLEVMLRVDDPEFAALVRTYLEGELADCRAVTREVHRRRSTPLRRMKWAMSYFLVTSMDYTVTRKLNFRKE